MARVADTKREPQPMGTLEANVREYKYLKDEIESLQTRQKKIRDILMEVVEEDGYVDDQGHYWYEFDDAIDGVASLQRQRRVSRSLDEDAAAAVLTPLGLWEQCTELKRVVDQDKVYEALYDGDINEADIDAIFPAKTTWALFLK